MLTFLLTHWRIFAVILLLTSSYAVGRLDGASRVQVRWDRQKLDDQQAVIAQIQKVQLQAAVNSVAYEAEAAKLRDTNQNIQRRLRDVLSQNNALRACNATDDFLSTYDSLITIH